MSRFLLKSLNKPAEEELSVNLTPLIDVVFVILIMFIIVVPLLEIDRVELANAPRDNDSPSIHESSINIHVTRDNHILFNNKRVCLDELAVLLKESKERHPQLRPQLYHDKEAYFGTYQSVKNVVEAAGFQQMDVILKPYASLA